MSPDPRVPFRWLLLLIVAAAVLAVIFGRIG